MNASEGANFPRHIVAMRHEGSLKHDTKSHSQRHEKNAIANRRGPEEAEEKPDPQEAVEPKIEGPSEEEVRRNLEESEEPEVASPARKARGTLASSTWVIKTKCSPPVKTRLGFS